MSGSLDDVLLLSDWNGTIVDDLDRARWALNEVLTQHVRDPLSDNDFRARFRLPMEALFADLGLAAQDGPAAETTWNALMAERPAPGRRGYEVLLRARERGAVVGVVSAATALSVLRDVRALGLDEVDVVMAPTVDKAVTLSALRPRRARAFYLGDTRYDMECAAAAGYATVAVAGGYTDIDQLVGAGARHVVEDLTEVLTIIEEHPS